MNEWVLKTLVNNVDTSTGNTLFRVKEIHLTKAYDEMVSAIANIDVEHREIHNGNFYSVFNRSTADKNQTAHLIIRTTTGNIKLHAIFICSCRGPTEFNFYEGSTIAGGATIVAYNRDRNSSNMTSAIFISNPTVVTTGILINNIQIGSSAGRPAGDDAGGREGSRQEWILKDNSTYELRAMSIVDDNIITLKSHFYEKEY